MIESGDLLAKARITRSHLHYVRLLRLIPKPARRGLPGCSGSACYYPDETLDIIRHINHLHARGISFPRIARRLGGTTFVSATHNPQLAAVQVNLAHIPDPQLTAKRLRAQVEGMLDGQELVALTVRVATEDGQPTAHLTGAFVR